MFQRFFRVVIVLTLLNYASTIPARAESACAESRGLVEQRTYHSDLLKAEMRYAVYTPSCYRQTTQRYPVIYLMHGSNATGTDYWLKLGLVETLDRGIKVGTLPPMIVVLPYGDWIANKNQFDQVSWGNIFLTELMPAAETAYRIETRRETRAIGGISRGGFWAFNIAFQHPELFSILGGHSAFFDLNHLRTANPLFLAETAPGLDSLRIWLDHGPDDYAGPNIDLLHRRLDARSIPHVYMVYPEGKHTPGYWASHVADYLLFYAADWFTASPVSALPLARNRQVEMPTLFLPAVGYRSLQVSISTERLRAMRDGGADKSLVLDQPTAEALTMLGLKLNSQTRIVAPADLLPLLEKDRSTWTLRAFEQLTPRYRLLQVDEVQPIYGLLNGDLDDYPFLFAPFQADQLTTFLFSGTTAIVRLTAKAVDANGTAWASEGLRGFTRRADFFHMSNEVSFYPTCPQFTGGGEPFGPFCAKDAYLDVIRALGADVIELSGNHNLDYGAGAYLRTLDMYRADGITTVAGGKNLEAARQPFQVTHHGNRIALLSCNWSGPQIALATDTTPGAAYCDDTWLATVIPQLKAANDVLIVSVQYKESDSMVPGARQRADFRKLADLGADVVLGTQAHVPQSFEFYPVARGGEAFIFYGLGNLYFDQTFFYMRSFMPELFIYQGQIKAVDLNVTIIDDLGRPRPMDDHNRIHFMSNMFVR